MKKAITLSIVLLAITMSSFSQKYITKNGMVKFYSESPMETIEAINNQVNAAIDTETGDMVFKVLIKGFEFEKALMQEHFNENYMHSDDFPNSTFIGKLSNLNDLDFTTDGKYEVTVEGDLTIKGVSNKVSVKGTLNLEGGKIIADAVFPVTLSDYEIKIPGAVVDNIAETVEVTVALSLEKYQK